MSTNLPIEVSDHAFQALASAAGNAGKTPAELAAAVVEQHSYGIQPRRPIQKRRGSSLSSALAVSTWVRPLVIANADIDRDLACVYESSTGAQIMLLDTSGLLALLDAREPLHAKARQTYAAAASRFTHAYVLAELVALGNARGVPARPLLRILDETPSQS